MAEPDRGDPPPEACAHHWVLSAPEHGGTSGECKHCGARREFSETDGRPAWRMRPKRPPAS